MKNLPRNYDIEAVFPAYSSKGDGTYIYLRDGTCRQYARRTKHVIHKLVQRQCMDIRLLRAQAARETPCKQGAPLGISADLVLVAFKMRRPRVNGDACLGYVNVSRNVQLLEKSQELYSPGSMVCGCGRPDAAGSASGLEIAETMEAYTSFDAGARSMLQLGSGRLLPSLWSYKTTQKYVQAGRAAHSRLLCELQGTLLQYHLEVENTTELL